ncbi:l1 transposable element-related [Holotrichia oblita]|uniref:L1 transposable element-related n=1 Tax=Holotrichia oblita TaxID=644536 RepID=A0ACB9TL33_HOLOL|nr:l1 transposable element-related [Holotrichia oblita]
MTLSCAVCAQVVGKRAHGIQCDECRTAFHAKCVGLSSDALTALSGEGSSWRCTTCRKGPARRTSVIICDDNSDSAMPNRDLLQSIDSQLKLLNSKYDTLMTSVAFCSDKISDFEKSLTLLENKCKVIDTLRTDNDKLKNQVMGLQKQLDDNSQYSRLYNIEIQGVPRKEGENIYKILESIGKEIQCPLDDLHIEYAHRVPTRNPLNKDGNIVARFFSRRIKENVLASAIKAKRNRRLTATGEGAVRGIKVAGLSDSIFINEHLSQKNKELFKATRDACKKSNFKFSWSKNGTVFVRKNEKSANRRTRKKEKEGRRWENREDERWKKKKEEGRRRTKKEEDVSAFIGNIIKLGKKTKLFGLVTLPCRREYLVANCFPPTNERLPQL